MQAVAIVTGVLLSPLLGFALLFWLAYLEDTLPRDVERAQRKPDPPPIRAIPARAVTPAQVVIPEQRTAPVPGLTEPTASGPAAAI